MSTYKEQQANKKSFVLLKNGIVLGTFGNLKKVTDFNEYFSYWTLSRHSDFPIKYKGFEIYKVKHY